MRLRAGLLLAVIAVPAAFAQAQTAAPPSPQVPMPPGMRLPPAVPPAVPPAAPSSPASPAAPAANAWEPKQTAELEALDKVDDKTATLSVPVNQSAQFGFLAISVRACLVRPPDQAADATAYLDIIDPRTDATGFHGWMFANEPSVSMLQHPVYDVRLVACH